MVKLGANAPCLRPEEERERDEPGRRREGEERGRWARGGRERVLSLRGKGEREKKGKSYERGEIE